MGTWDCEKMATPFKSDQMRIEWLDDPEHKAEAEALINHCFGDVQVIYGDETYDGLISALKIKPRQQGVEFLPSRDGEKRELEIDSQTIPAENKISESLVYACFKGQIERDLKWAKLAKNG